MYCSHDKRKQLSVQCRLKFPSINIGCLCVVDLTTDMTVWDGIVVTPSDKAYEKKEDEEKDAGNEERMDVQQAK